MRMPSHQIWLETESNRRHKDFQSFALPTELSSLNKNLIIIQLSFHYWINRLRSGWSSAQMVFFKEKDIALPTELSSLNKNLIIIQLFVPLLELIAYGPVGPRRRWSFSKKKTLLYRLSYRALIKN